MKLTNLCLLCILAITHSLAQAKTPTPKYPSPYIQSAKNHFVQFFSSGNATKAEGMKNTLEMQGYPAFVFINTPQQTKRAFYQVQIGPFATRDLALKAKIQVIKKYPQYHFLNDAILKTTL